MTSAKRTEVMSIIKAYSGQQNVIGIPRIYVKLTGDYASAALLNQILYWSERTSDPDGWFYKSYAEWEGELYLSQYQVKRIIEGDKRSKSKTCLKDLGVETLLKKSKKGAPTLHYRIDETVFMKALMEQIEADKPPQAKEENSVQEPIVNNVDNPIMNNVDNPLSTLSTMDSEQCQQSLRTKTTQETTAENKTPLPPVDTELQEMENAVRVELKQYNKKQRSNVAKSLLRRHDDPDKDTKQKLTPDQLKEFGAWWDKTKRKDDKPLTRPKNMGSVKTWVDEWLDTHSERQQAMKELELRRQHTRLPLNIDQLDTGSMKEAG